MKNKKYIFNNKKRENANKQKQDNVKLPFKTILKNFFSKLIFGEVDIWKTKDLNKSFDDAKTGLETIIKRKQSYHLRLKRSRFVFITVFVFMGFAGILSSSYFVGQKFYNSSFQQGYNKYYEKSGRIIIHFDKRPGEAAAPDPATLVSNVQQNINILFSNKIIDNPNWGPSSVNVVAISDNEVSVTGQQELINKLSAIYKLWTTNDQAMTLTDQLGDQMTLGVTKDPATQVWIKNLLAWDKVYYNPSMTDAFVTETINSLITISEKDCGAFLGQPLTTNIFSTVTNSNFVGGTKNDYGLTFTVSNTQKWTAFTTFLYDLTNWTLYKLHDANNKPIFSQQTEADKKTKNNHYLHMFVFFWYGLNPAINTNTPKNADGSYIMNQTNANNTKSYFDSLFLPSSLGSQTNSYTVEGMENTSNGQRRGDNPFFRTTNRNSSNLLNPIYQMKQEDKNDKLWQQGKLIGIFTIDFDNNFKAGASGTSIDFSNPAKTPPTNNLSYIIRSKTPTVKDDSKNSALAIANSLRNSLGTYYAKIASVTSLKPLLFEYYCLLFALVGFLLVFIGLSFYLIRRYKWLGVLGFFALLSFIYAIFVSFTIFQTNFQPSMIIITIVGMLIMVINLFMVFEKFSRAYKVPKEKTLLETVIERNKKIFYRFIEFNVPLFITLYLGFTMILQTLAGSNVLWMVFIFAMFIIITAYVLVFTIFLLENKIKIRKNYKSLSINAEIVEEQQLTKEYFYMAKSSDLNIQDAKIIDEKFLSSEEEEKAINKETKKLNRKKVSKNLDSLMNRVGEKNDKNNEK